MTAATMTKTKKATRRVATVTYNRLGEGEYDNGVAKGDGIELFIAQNGHKSEWAADPDYGDSESRARTRARMAEQVAKMVDLRDMDHVFIYVGANGSETAIRQSHDLPADRVTYVMCDCNWGSKVNLISRIGNGNARKIECSCGGQDKLARIASRLLAGATPDQII